MLQLTDRPTDNLYKLLLTLLIACASLTANGQGNSVTVAVSLTPPYSLVLSDYAKPASQQLVTTIMVNDMRIVNMPVRLHIKMETATGVTIETAPNILVNALYLSGGMTHLLFGRDLAPYFDINNLTFKGYSKEDYRRTGQLPEGFYRFSVELRHFITGRPVGNPGKAMAWIAIGKPPTLKSPEDKAELGQIQGAALTFSWIPTIVGVPNGGAQYKFELWELRIPGINPNVIVQSMPAKYTATQMHSTLIVHPTEMFLEPGMNYAWRVTASDIAGMLPYAQDGHSEVRTFTYQCKCDSVTNFTVKRVGKQATFKWEPAANHTSFNVEMDNPGSDWTRKEQTFNSQATLNFAEGKTYRMRIQSICNGNAENASPFTNWLSVTIPVPKPIAEDCPNCVCENPVPEPKVTNWELRQDLKPGDTIHTPSGKTRFILKSVNLQPDGSYKGLLLVWIEIWRIKILCEYWDLRVNTDNQKVMGKYESIYDPTLLLDVGATEKYVDDLADAIAAISTNTKIRDSIKIGAPLEGAYINKDNNIVLITRSTDGTLTETVSQSTAKMRATLVKGSDGEEYVVTDDGQMMGKEEFAATGGDSRLMNNHNEEKEATASPSVTFTAAEGQQYGFDSYTETKAAVQNEYPELKAGYRPAFKSIESYKTDKVQARTTKNVSFRTELGVPPMNSGNDLIVRGGTNGEEIALYAYSKEGDKEVVAGKLTVLSFDENKKTVYLVSVNGATLPNETTLKQELDKIYSPAIVKWTVTKGKALNNVVFPNGKMTHGGSNAISVYNTDQKKIIKAFGSMDKDALYLFFVSNVQGKDGSTKGYMPMQHQSGFIYDNTDAVIVAHELAHGAFNLAHTFDNKKFISPQGTTDNLLDYKGGTQLWKHQWKLINNPEGLLFSFLQDEEDVEMRGQDSISLEEKTIALKNKIIPELVNDIKSKLDAGNYSRKEKEYIEGAIDNVQYIIDNTDFVTETKLGSTGWYEYGVLNVTYRGYEDENDIKVTLFHEYLHHINYLYKLYEYRYEDVEQRKIYTVEDSCFLWGKASMDAVYYDFSIYSKEFDIKTWADDYDNLESAQKQKVIDFKEKHKDLYEKTKCSSGIYFPSNSLRDEIAVREVCFKLNGIIFDMTETKISKYQKDIEDIKNRIVNAEKYEIRNNKDERGYEK
ncbi:hypothetical protein FACS1894199_02290 [Bacteroidia bacterium]|nr:hypothetical protein FACS1894199_02290 [Bacteroidia bacterium]